MHYIIAKFWEDAGYSLISNKSYYTRIDDKKEQQISWFVKNAPYDIQISLKAASWDYPTYYFNGKAYTEDYMLKIVKLRAFI